MYSKILYNKVGLYRIIQNSKLNSTSISIPSDEGEFLENWYWKQSDMYWVMLRDLNYPNKKANSVKEDHTGHIILPMPAWDLHRWVAYIVNSDLHILSF